MLRNDSTGVVMTAEYQHWLDGMLVNGTETFEGAVEGGFSVYTREIAGSIRLSDYSPDSFMTRFA